MTPERKKIERAKAAFERLRKARRGVSVSTFEMGQALFDIERMSYWAVAGASSFTDYLRREGINPSRASYYLGRYRHCVHAADLTIEDVAGLDPDLLYEVRRSLVPNGAKEVIADARKVTAGEMGQDEFLAAYGPMVEEREAALPVPEPESPVPTVERGKVEDTVESVMAWQPEQRERLCREIASRTDTSTASSAAALAVVRRLGTDDLKEFVIGLVQSTVLRNHPDVIGWIVVALCDLLDIEALTRVVGSLDEVYTAKSQARRTCSRAAKRDEQQPQALA